MKRPEWRDVLRVIQEEKTRQAFLADYKTLGFTADDFARNQDSRRHAAICLSRQEDRLELTKGSLAQREREEIKIVRRLLELESE